MSMQQSSATDQGTRFIAALADRDFSQLADTLTRDVQIRALIPPGLVEISGAEAAAAKFSSWFGDAEEFELVRSGTDAFADRGHVFYQLRVKKPGGAPKLLEQHLLCAFEGDQVRAFDLVCSGFRPDEAARHATDPNE
jgi:hypothetical protein